MASKCKSDSTVRQESKKGMTTTTTLNDSNDKVMYHTCHCPSNKNIEFLLLADNLMFPINEARIAESCKDERHQYRVTFIVGTNLRCSQMKCFITAFLEGMKKAMPNKFFVIQIAIGSFDFVWLTSKGGNVRIERRSSKDIFQELQSLKESIHSFFPSALVFFYPLPDLSTALRTGSDSPDREAENKLEMEISNLNKKLQDCNNDFFSIPGEKSHKDTWACKNVRKKYSKIWRFVSEKRVSVDPKTGIHLTSFLHDSVFDFACCMFKKAGKNLNWKRTNKEKKCDTNPKSGMEESSETEKACLKKQVPGASSTQGTTRTESKNSDCILESPESELEQGELIDSDDETSEASEPSENSQLKKGHSSHLKSSERESKQSSVEGISSRDKKPSVEIDTRSSSDGGNSKPSWMGGRSSRDTNTRDRGKSLSSHGSPDRGKSSKGSQNNLLDRKLSLDGKDSSHRIKSSHSYRHSSHGERKSSHSKTSSGRRQSGRRHKHSSHRISLNSDKDSHHQKQSKDRSSSHGRRLSHDRGSSRGRRSSHDRDSSERRKSWEKEWELYDRSLSPEEDWHDSRKSPQEDRRTHFRRKSSGERYSSEKRRSSKRDKSPSSWRHSPFDEKTSSDGRSDDTRVFPDRRRKSWDRDRSTSKNQRSRSFDRDERVVLSSDRSASPQSSNSIILLSQDPNPAASPASDSSRSTQIFTLNKNPEKPAHETKPEVSDTFDSLTLSSTSSTSKDDSNPYRKDHGLRDLYSCHENECKRYLAKPYAHPDYAKEKKLFTSKWLAKNQSDVIYDATMLDWDWNIFWKSRMKELFDESWKMKKEIYRTQKKKAVEERRKKRGMNDVDFEHYLSSVREYSTEEKVQKWKTTKKRKHSGSADRSYDSVSDEIHKEDRTKTHSHAESKCQEKDLKISPSKSKQKEIAPEADCQKIDASVVKEVIGSLVFPETHVDPVIEKLLTVLRIHPHLALLTASLKYMLDYALKCRTKMEDTVTFLEDEDNLIVLEMVQKKIRSLLQKDEGNNDLAQDLQKALKATEELIAMGKSIEKPHFGLNLYSLAVTTRGVEEDVLMCLVEGLALCSGREVNSENVQQTCKVVQSLLK